ncbi:MAG: molybdopterin molybdotransferase MoeA [Verrucomicrobiae bacterium]|nr:molybdopterin molybdotransferase MoeA [Verrucomicrobiae bacterium]
MDSITPAEADKIIAGNLRLLEPERVHFSKAYRGVLREPVLADRDFPPYDRVMMDGIAVCLDGSSRVSFVSAGVQRAGIPAQTLPGLDFCFEVMTGAVLPEGCNAVIPVEEVVESEGKFSLKENFNPEPGQFIHSQGSDNQKGDLLLPTGQYLAAKEVAVLTTCGYTEVAVTRIPRIVIVSTGDELVEVDADPGPFQIRKSNVHALQAACLALPTPTQIELHHLPDDRSVISGSLPGLLKQADVLLFSGGISKGKYDFLQEVLAEAGVVKHFQWVNQRPGKPLWFGSVKSGPLVFALPGNPNSTLTCFYRYAASAICALTGIKAKQPEMAFLKLPYRFAPLLAQFLPVKAERAETGRLEVEPVATQNSGDLSRLALSDGFIELPADQKEFPVGFLAPFYPW